LFFYQFHNLLNCDQSTHGNIVVDEPTWTHWFLRWLHAFRVKKKMTDTYVSSGLPGIEHIVWKVQPADENPSAYQTECYVQLWTIKEKRCTWRPWLLIP
jgi:hypothetical protein